MTTYLDSEGIITNHQHGFVRGRSCLTNLLEFLNWTPNLDEGYGVDYKIVHGVQIKKKKIVKRK